MAAQAWCPQWWGVFSVRGNTGIYEVYSDHVLRGTWRCGCRGSMFGFSCKHIRRVLRHGCLAGPGRPVPGRNDLGGAVRVSITNKPHPVPRATTEAHPAALCECGEMMLAPLLRMDDGAGHQIVEVQFDGGRAQYAYAWGGQRALIVGELVSCDTRSHISIELHGQEVDSVGRVATGLCSTVRLPSRRALPAPGRWGAKPEDGAQGGGCSIQRPPGQGEDRAGERE